MDIGGWIGVLWVASGVVGAVMLIAKGKLNLGFMTWVVFGWWGLFFAVVVGGGLLFLWGYLAQSPVKCPSCRRDVDRRATKCPYCQSNLEPTTASAS